MRPGHRLSVDERVPLCAGLQSVADPLLPSFVLGSGRAWRFSSRAGGSSASFTSRARDSFTSVRRDGPLMPFRGG